MQTGSAIALTQMLKRLDPSVLETYAWFVVGGGEDAPSNLIDNDSGGLNAMGRVYAAA